MPATEDYDQAAQAFTPQNNPMPNHSEGQATQAYYYSMEWWDYGNGSEGGYTGLQTDSAGKRAIYSQWGGITGYGPGTSQSFGNEGTGWQELIPFNWSAGTEYVLYVYYNFTTSGGSWFTDTITNTGANYTIGTIEIPVSYGSMQRFFVNFVEWYGSNQGSCNYYPYSKNEFAQLVGVPRSNDPPVLANDSGSQTPYGNQCSTVHHNGGYMLHVNGET